MQVGKASLAAYKQNPESFSQFYTDSCSWCLRKEGVLPFCLGRKLPNERNRRTMCIWKTVPPVCPKATLFNNWATGAKVSGVFWLLGVLEFFSSYREPFSSLLNAPVYLAVRCCLEAGCGVCVWQHKEPVPASPSRIDHCLA